jgi:two-component system sensor histidine kinase FlrB
MQSLPIDRQEKLIRAPDSLTGQQLAAAFASFLQTAGVLETSYRKLQAEVGRLRHELENKNRSLAQSLEENRRMRAYLGSIVESLPCGVLVLDAKRQLRVINPAARALLMGGASSPVTEAEVARLLEPLLAGLHAENLAGEQEWTVKGAEGERTLGVARAVLTAPDRSADSVLILRDVTAARQLEREREAARRTQALAEMATVLAHEIRNPLGSLELFAGLLADALEDQGELQPWINHMQAGLRSLAATVNNVLHFHSQPPAQLLRIDLGRLVTQSVEFLRPLARQKGMHIEWHAPLGALTMLADAARLQQAFLNLALNAFRAMKPGGSLRISSACRREASGPVVALTFADQGVGIAPGDLAKIFAPGYTTHPGSPGIGLAVTRKVVEQHCGKIQVESQPGVGTSFTLRFPLEGAEG